MSQLNFGAILVAAASSFLLGGLWYSRILFGVVWMREAGYVEGQGYHPARVFGLSFVMSVASAIVFALLLGPAPVLKDATLRGLLVGAGVAGTSFAINYQFAKRSLLLLLIDAGYHTFQFGLYGMILGLWH